MLSWWFPDILAHSLGALHVVYWMAGIALVSAQTATLLRLGRARSGLVAPRGTAHEAAWAIVPVAMLIVLGLLSTRASTAAHVDRTPAAHAAQGLRDR